MRQVQKFSLVFLFFLALTGLRTFPLLTHLDTYIPLTSYDSLLNTWTLAWNVHALTTEPLDLFNANIFYPATRSLAFSEHMLGVWPIFAPVFLLTGNPILGYNVLFFLSFVLSGFAMFCLAYYWTRTFWPALVAGTLFAFAPIRLAEIGRIQLLNFFWAPFALIFLDRFLRTRRWTDLTVFSSFYWLQVLSSVYLGYMISIAVALYVSYYVLLVDRTLLHLAILPKALTFLGGSLLILLPVHLPYLKVFHEWGISRVYGDLIKSDVYAYSSADLLDYLSVPPIMADFYRYFVRSFLRVPETVSVNGLFPGLVLPTLVLLGTGFRLESVEFARVRTLRRIFWLILGSAFLLSLGPFLVVLKQKTDIPLPYLLLFHTIPGFSAVRLPARFAFLVVLAAAPLAALGALKLSEAFQRLTQAKPMATLARPLIPLSLMALALIELGLKPLPLAKIPTGQEIPEVYRWLAANRPGPIVEFPTGFLQDYEYLYYSISHWLPLVNGASGYFPPTYLEIRSALRSLPSRTAVEHLKAIGVRAVVVHTDRLRPDELSPWNSAQLEETGLQKVKAFGPDVLYRVPSGSSTSRLRLQIRAPDWLPHGKQITLQLSLRGAAGAAWSHPKPHELYTLSTARVEWKTSGSTTVISKTTLRLPFVILPEATVEAPVTLETPRTPGMYSLHLSIPSLEAESESRTVEIRDASYPTSLNAPHLLSATYISPQGRSPLSVNRSDSIPLTLLAQNTGRAVWLAEAREDKGAVRLGWRWLRGNQEIPETEGRTALPYDLFPGQSYQFKTLIDSPQDPGTYTLQLGLVTEHVHWFSELGIPPLRLTVTVEHTSPCESFDNLLAQSGVSSEDSPRLRLATSRSRYRAGNGVVRLFLKLDNVEKSRAADLYLALLGPGCRLYFLEYDQGPVAYRGGLGPIFWRLILPQAFDRPHFLIHSFPLAGLPQGPYLIHLLVTEPNGTRLVTQATVPFRIEP